MAKFNVGSLVIDVISNRKGTIVSVGSPSRGRQTYGVMFAKADRQETMLESFLKADYDISDPFERCKNHKYGSYIDFARINTSYKIENTCNSTIASLKASKTIFKPYQFKPLLKFLNSENRRLLIADEVGLGKTIEAGHIMIELLARKELKNVLIVCPNSLRMKWKNEMEEKFNLKFKIYDNVQDFSSDIQIRNGSFRGIVNYEKLHAPKTKETSSKSNAFLDTITTSKINFSLVLLDEAHRVRNANTATYKGVEIIADVSRAIVMLTATPIMISAENLYNILHILSPIEYDNNMEFTNSLSLNKPFLHTLRELKTKRSLRSICTDLKEAQIKLQYRFYQYGTEYCREKNVSVSEYYANNPLYQRCVTLMESGDDTIAIRAKLQKDINSMSELNHILSRTIRREITTDWTQAVRHPFPILVDLYPDERVEFDNVIEQYIDANSCLNDEGEVVMKQGIALGLIAKKRQVASSVYAYLNTLKDLQQGVDLYDACEDAKVNILLKILHEIFGTNGEKKVILFAIFQKTLYYLRIRLQQYGYNCALIVGGMENRNEELARFKQDNSVQILLSSEVGSEGLDLQFCCSMINYDLPWNPMVVEQRIGRIDRFGQVSPIVKIYNFIVHNSIQEDIYYRLLDRIGIFRETIGDLEAILDANIDGQTIQSMYNSLEKELFCNKLSKEERERKLENIAQAIENEKLQIKNIEENQTNTLTVDTYFNDEVNRILTTHAYLTDRELKAYVELLIKKQLPTCSLNDMGDGTYLFKLPKSNIGCLKNFLTQYVPIEDDIQSQLADFKIKTMQKSEFLLTFTQDVAYNKPDIIFVNVTHPIIQAILQFFKAERNPNDITFVFDIDKKYIPAELKESSYFLAIYSIETSYKVQGATKITTIQYPILYDWKNDTIISDKILVYKMLGQSQVYGQYHTTSSLPNYSEVDIENLKIALLEDVSTYVKTTKDDLDVKLRSQQNIKLTQIENFHLFKEMKQLEERLSRAKEALLLAYSKEEEKKAIQNIKTTETLMQKEEDKYQEKRALLMQDFNLFIDRKLISLNLINIC